MTDHGPMSHDELMDEFERGPIEIRKMQAKNASLLARIDRLRSYRRYGYLSTSAYLPYRSGETEQSAAGEVRVARALGHMPATSTAYAEGEIDSTKVHEIVLFAAPERPSATIDRAMPAAIEGLDPEKSLSKRRSNADPPERTAPTA